MPDGIMVSISTAAISALVGAGGGAWIMSAIGRGKCSRCPDHERLDTETRLARESIAEIKADLRNICRSLDELRDDLRAMRGAIPPVQLPR